MPITIKIPPPIFIRGIGDIHGLSVELTNLNSSYNLFFKVSLTALKFKLYSQPNAYRKTIHYLKDKMPCSTRINYMKKNLKTTDFI